MTDVLLLHGQPGLARDWDRVVAALPDGWRTLAIDRPGWDGRSRATDLAGNAAAAIRALERADVGRATVVGHSWGAAVAAWMASTYPERVAALVLAAPSANRASLLWFDELLAVPGVGYGVTVASLAGPGYALALGPVRRLIAVQLGLDNRYLDGIGAALRRPDAWRTFFFEQRTLIQELPELELRLARISAPATILAGDRDPIVPLSSARLLADQIEGARLVVLPKAGHLLPARRPKQLADAIVSATDPGGRAMSRVSLD